MNPNDFESRMREGEFFHSLRLLRGAWCVLRVDGRGFSRFTEANYEKPFDVRLHEQMVRTASALMEDLQAVYAYTESDEISLLFRPDWSLYDREVEKLVSLSAGLASATFTQASGRLAVFDSRVWMGVNEAAVLDYFRWRQADATRCALNAWCYWTLRKEGQSVAQATQALDSQSVGFKNELLFQRGINFNEVPLWQRRGSGVVWERYDKEGLNPVTGQTVLTTRRRLRVDEALPMGEVYDGYLRERFQP